MLFFTQGIGLIRPMASDKFVTNKIQNSAELDYPYIFIVDKEIV